MNEKNLIPGAHKLTLEEQSRGGKASAISRSFRSATKKKLRENPELFDEIISMLINMTKQQNLKALELLLELAGESPKQMEIALKKRELKLKEELTKGGISGEKELPALLSALEGGDGE